jgi:hypothetical protein
MRQPAEVVAKIGKSIGESNRRHALLASPPDQCAGAPRETGLIWVSIFSAIRQPDDRHRKGSD